MKQLANLKQKLKDIVSPTEDNLALEQPTIKKVAIFGSADISQHDPLFSTVFTCAQYLAQKGKVVVNGGGPGVMLAATKGAKSVGGQVTTVTFQPKNMPEFEGRDQENMADFEIKTTNYVARMFHLMKESDAFVCFKGGTGTLSEWATAWLLSHLNYGQHKPMILYGAFWRDLLEVIVNNFFIGKKERSIYKIVTNHEEFVQALEEFEQDLAQRD